MRVLYIFPTTLFYKLKFEEYDLIIVVEEPRYFTDFNFHKLKLVYHKSTMEKYFESINHKNKIYIEFSKAENIYLKYSKHECFGFTLFDFEIENKIKKQNPKFIWLESPNFLFTRSELEEIKLKRQNPFYIQNRKRLNILMNDNGTPLGGTWNYDKDNRGKETEYNVKTMQTYKPDKTSISYINKHFPDNYGECDVMYYPTTHKESMKALNHFIKYDLLKFTFQDAINNDISNFEQSKLYHSVLSPMMNIGLLTDKIILHSMQPVFDFLYKTFKNKNETETQKNKHYQLLCSVEGFIRQIIGWRQYMLYIYVNNKNIKKENFMKFTKPISKIMERKLWYGETGIVPVDIVVQKIHKYAYAHHIERLMVLGNFLFISEFKPKDVYDMFMCWTIDSYDWVMASNIFTMSQFSTGTSYTTKPYFSSSNYILKMSNHKKGEWCETWDEIYKTFKTKNKFLQKYLIHNF